jgi:hypothetical protein
MKAIIRRRETMRIRVGASTLSALCSVLFTAGAFATEARKLDFYPGLQEKLPPSGFHIGTIEPKQ